MCFPLAEYDMCSRLLFIYIASTLSGLLLRLGGFWGVLGECATNQLPMEFPFEHPLLVIRSDGSFWDNRSCNGCNTLFYTLALVLVFTKSLHVCNFDPGAHVIYAFGFDFKIGCHTTISSYTMVVLQKTLRFATNLKSVHDVHIA
jgi:hypothetical protein